MTKKKPAAVSPPWLGPPELEPLLVGINTLSTDLNNARLHNERSIKAVSTSLSMFGQRKPIVVRKGVVIAGNGMLQAAIKAGWTKIAVTVADDMSDEQATAYAIADNRTAELSEWDFAVLGESLKELPEDIRFDIGFSAAEITPILDASWGEEKDKKTPPTRPEPKHTITMNAAQWATFTAAAERVAQAWREKGQTAAPTHGDVVTEACNALLRARV